MLEPLKPYEWIIRFSATLLLISAFLLVLLPSLWKLAMSRPGLIIVFSRSSGNLCRLLRDIPTFVVSYMLHIWTDKTPTAYIYPLNGITNMLTIVQHTHNLALAVNRAHAINVLLLCSLLWLLAIPFAASDQIILTLLNHDNYDNNYSPTFLLTKYCMYAAGLVYATIGGRILWMKYKTKSLVVSSAEKDSLKILVVCFACLTMSAMHQLVMRQTIAYFSNFPSHIVQRVAFWVYNCFYWLGLCTEEISLCLLVRDFRKHLKQQLRALLFCRPKQNMVGITTAATM